MFERDDRIYYERRAAHASEQGDRASDPTIGALHYELALRYAAMAVRVNQARPEVVGLGGGRRCDIRLPAIAMSRGSPEPEMPQTPIVRHA